MKSFSRKKNQENDFFKYENEKIKEIAEYFKEMKKKNENSVEMDDYESTAAYIEVLIIFLFFIFS